MKDKDDQKSFMIPEIVKLSERLAKDPTSKLFVSLAEEYFKAGMLEEAVTVLIDGLKIHPGFISAHLMLGKVYLEKGKIKEAKEQFETVIQSSPDNLLAHRKLVKIYSEGGAIQKAIQSCRAILSSDPKDEEMKKALADLEAGQRDVAAAQNLQPELVRTQHADLTKDASSPVLEQGPERMGELNSMPAEEKETEHAIELKEEEQEAIASPISGDREKGRVIELEDDEGSFEEIMNLMGQEEKVEPAAKATEEELATESLAELYMKQGFYDKGVEIYQALVSKDPANEPLLKKLKDAVTFLKNASKAPAESNEANAERPPAAISNRSGAAVVTEEVHAEARFKPEEPHPATSFKPSPARLSKAEKIQKLQAWLEQVKRSQKQ